MMSNVDTTMSHEDFELLCKLRTTAREAEDTYLRAAEDAKRAKKSMEAAQLRVNRLLDDLADGPLPLEEQAERNRGGADASGLFDDGKPADEPIGVGEEPGEFDVLAESELWKGVAIDEIFLPPAVLKKLKAANITTIGDLADFSNGGKDLTDIAGIGEETKNSIVDAMISYFQINPIPKPPVITPSHQMAQDEPAEKSDADDLEATEGTPEGRTEPPKGRRRKKSRGEPENGADPTSEEVE